MSHTFLQFSLRNINSQVKYVTHPNSLKPQIFSKFNDKTKKNNKEKLKRFENKSHT